MIGLDIDQDDHVYIIIGIDKTKARTLQCK